jgi:dTDP-4-amino-4,6-dideoxygalactose transaminase
MMPGNAQMKIPMLDLKIQYQRIGAEIQDAIKRVLESQQLILGPEVIEFERELAAYCGVTQAIGCASGSDALLLGLMACNVKPGDEVITTPFSFFATAGSIVRLGAKPVFVDIESATFNMDPRILERAITKRTKAVIPVHLFGQCVEMDVVNEISKHYSLSVIEDAAQAIGAEYKGVRAGGLGKVAAFSFYPSKNLGCAGDGGAVTTDDQEISERIRTLRAHGAKKKYYHQVVGINSRLDSLQAAILRAKFSYLDEWAYERRENAHRYGLLFKESIEKLAGRVQLPIESIQGTHVYNQFVIRAQNRDELRAYLAGRGVSTEVYYPVPLHLQECFRDLGYSKGDLPESELAAQEALALPIYPELEERAQEFIVRALCSFYGSA